MSETLKQKFCRFLTEFIEILLMNDAIFFANLTATNLFPGDTKAVIEAKETRAKKAQNFLESCIEPAFYLHPNCNKSLNVLLGVMEKSDYQAVKELANEFNC